ncbi:MAG: transaldolase family protein [Candidatus Gracilibacteria bacterium]
MDGQTTNPSLIAKTLKLKNACRKGKIHIKKEVYDFYRNVITEISGLIPDGSVSIEVYADAATTADAMFTQGKEMYTWIPNAHIKYPTTAAGLEAARKIGTGRHAGTGPSASARTGRSSFMRQPSGAVKGQVFLSPFVGRLDDIGQNGMDLIKNILEMYRESDHHVEVLSASVRTLEHFMSAIQMQSDIITAPYKVIREWAEKGMPIPDASFSYTRPDLQPVPEEKLNLDQQWQNFSIQHDLTSKRIENLKRRLERPCSVTQKIHGTPLQRFNAGGRRCAGRNHEIARAIPRLPQHHSGP